MNTNQPLNLTGSDEIDLVDLFHSLWGQKWLIMGVVAVVGAAAGAYAFRATPVYEVQSLLRPALVKDLDELNGSEVYKLEPLDALKRVGASLESYDTRESFFQANRSLFEGLGNPGSTLDQSFENFSREQFTILRPDPKKADGLPDYVGIQVTYPDGLDGAAIANGLVAHAIAVERERIAADFKVVITNRLSKVERQIKASRANYEADKASRIAQISEADALKRADLQDELTALRQQLRTKRHNRIAELDEAIGIAEKLAITKPTTPAAMGEQGRVSLGSGSVIRTEVNNQQIPLYFMGTETLSAERDALLARRSDDFAEPRVAEIAKELKLLESNRQIELLKKRTDEDLFLTQLAQLREEEARLKGLDLDLSSLSLVRIDRPALQPSQPVRPRKALIVAVGLVLGGVLGVFAALIRGFVKRRLSVTTAAA